MSEYVVKSGTIVDGILHGSRWTGGYITYSFPDQFSDYGAGYGTDVVNGRWLIDNNGNGLSIAQENFYYARDDQQDFVRFFLDSAYGGGYSVEGFTNLNIGYRGFGNGSGTIRFANTDDYPSGFVTDFPYPSETGIGRYSGDVFIGPLAYGQTAAPGTYHGLTIMHELGHALGLKHPHNNGGTNVYNDRLPVGYNSIEYTVMSYNSYPGGNNSGYEDLGYAFPQTYMLLDIYALQYLYGADYTARSGNTYYQWDAAGNSFIDGRFSLGSHYGKIFQTIWDGGGNDTYDLSNFAGGISVNLNPGSHSYFSPGNLAYLGNNIWAKGNVYNAWQWGSDTRSLIENAIGGTGNDSIVGNAVANFLRGNAGNDTIVGGAGSDWLHGGRGADRLVGGTEGDRFDYNSILESTLSGQDTINGFAGVGLAGGDVIDLQDIDADVTTAANDTFTLWFRGKGGAWLFELSDGSTQCALNVDNDAAWEFAVIILDGTQRAAAYSINEFLL